MNVFRRALKIFKAVRRTVAIAFVLLAVYFLGSLARWKPEVRCDYDSNKLFEEGEVVRHLATFTADVIRERPGIELITVQYIAPEPHSRGYPTSSIKVYTQSGNLIVEVNGIKDLDVYNTSQGSSQEIKLSRNRAGFNFDVSRGVKLVSRKIYTVLEEAGEYKITPACTDMPNKCSFYFLEDALEMDDFDKDGFLEVIEYGGRLLPTKVVGSIFLSRVYKYNEGQNEFIELRKGGSDYSELYNALKTSAESIAKDYKSRGLMYENFVDFWERFLEA